MNFFQEKYFDAAIALIPAKYTDTKETASISG